MIIYTTIAYTTISTDEDNYRLSAQMTDNGGYEIPSLEILLDGEKIAFWDNEIFLYNTVYPILKGEKNDTKIINTIPKDDHKELLEVFEKAEKMGFFNNIKNNNSHFDKNAKEDIPYDF